MATGVRMSLAAGRWHGRHRTREAWQVPRDFNLSHRLECVRALAAARLAAWSAAAHPGHLKPSL